MLGRGNVAEVYQAITPDLETEVALKVLLPPPTYQVPQIAALTERFSQVMTRVSRLEHPNIVHIYDYGTLGSVHYVVQELIEGTSLRDLLSERRSGLPQTMALAIFRQIAEGLAYAHQQGVVHQDIRPSNILLEGGTRPVVSDFGMPRILGEEDATTAQFSPRAPIYMSPEQASGEPATPQSDIYALGILLYEMMTGDVPFKGTAARILVQHIQDMPRPPSELNVNLDPRLEMVIMKALEKDPSQRFESPRQMVGMTQREPVTATEYDTITLGKNDAIEMRERFSAAQQAREESQAASEAAVDRRKLILIAGGLALAILVIVILVLALSQGGG